jgi:serine/threonine protein kinase
MLDQGGASLDRLLRDSRPPLAEALRIGAVTAAAQGSVHSRNIIHRDINPTNIAMNPQTGTIELIDFGIATELARGATAPGGQILESTLAHMAPEQTGRTNRSVGWRADLYALGATLYELIPETKRAMVRLSIGRLMLTGAGDPERSERLFDLLAQINQGHALISDPANGGWWCS